jgi:RimJ/RimL family protein N-acetyltransferase
MIIAAHSLGTLIRPLVPDDRDSVYAAVRESIDTVGRWMSWCHPDYSMREVDQWIATCERNWNVDCADREFGIFDEEGGEVLGGVGINQINCVNSFANLGYWVRASRTGSGIASTAARLAAQFAFRELKLSRIEIVARVDNIASRRVAEKIGARFECIARHRLLYKGRPYDAALYSLLPGEIIG